MQYLFRQRLKDKRPYIADAIQFALTRPRSVALNEVTIRPYWQER